MTSEKIEKKWQWTDEYLIGSYDVDAQGKVWLPALGKFMQETAYHHAHHLEFGYHQLKEKNFFWVLSRLLIKIEKYPQWGDKILLSTWPSGIEGLLAYRDFRVTDEQGELIAVAGSAWLVLDTERRRPQRQDGLREISDLFPREQALEERPTKIPALANPVEGNFFPVRYSDLDLYNHVNNAKYMEWILDSYPERMHREFKLSRFEINFLSETKIGDEVAIYTEKGEESSLVFHHGVKRKADNRDICLASAEWKSE